MKKNAEFRMELTLTEDERKDLEKAMNIFGQCLSEMKVGQATLGIIEDGIIEICYGKYQLTLNEFESMYINMQRILQGSQINYTVE